MSNNQFYAYSRLRELVKGEGAILEIDTAALYDAKALPFPSAHFDTLICYHRPIGDVPPFLQECRRILKPGGLLGIVATTCPEHSKAARYCNLFEQLHDPDQPQTYSPKTWEQWFTEAGFTIKVKEKISSPQQLHLWAAACDMRTLHRLRTLLLQAPRPVRAWYELKAEPGWSPLLDIPFVIQQGLWVVHLSPS